MEILSQYRKYAQDPLKGLLPVWIAGQYVDASWSL